MSALGRKHLHRERTQAEHMDRDTGLAYVGLAVVLAMAGIVLAWVLGGDPLGFVAGVGEAR